MKPSIEIKFRDVPREVLVDFENKIDKSIEVSVQEATDQSSGEITIELNEHLTELIIHGDVNLGIGNGLSALWKRVKKEQSIELSFRLKLEKIIEFDLNGNIDPNRIDAVIENIVRYLKDSNQQKKDFENPDFKAQDDVKPKLRIRYNPFTDQLEVVNYTVVRKKMEEAFKRLAGKFKN